MSISWVSLHQQKEKRVAFEMGPRTVESAPGAQDLGLMTYGVDQAGRGWLEKSDVLNTLSLEEMQTWTKRRSSP